MYPPENLLPPDEMTNRWWRVQAKVEDEAWTRWSEPVNTIYYKNAYERIKLTGKLVVGVSSDRSQGIFKFLDGETPAGVDIELANRVAKHLTTEMKKEVKLETRPRNWGKLFEPLGNGDADLVIAAVTKLPSREVKNNIIFSQSYFCTGKSLLYSTKSGVKPIKCDTSVRCNTSVRSLLKGKVVGYGEGTASEELIVKLANEMGKSFSTRTFPQVEDPIILLTHNSGIQFAVTDTAFAEVRVLEEEKGVLDSVRFCKCDYPHEYKPLDEYGIAVDQSETELLNAINATIIDLKKNWSLDKILERAATERFPKTDHEKLRPVYTSECSGD